MIPAWIIYTIGFLAQFLFSGRIFIQWILSERAKKVSTPVIFWKLSLIASFLLFIYGYFRGDFAIMLGQLITYFIYIRNMQLQGVFQKFHFFFKFSVLVFPFIMLGYFLWFSDLQLEYLVSQENIPLYVLTLGIVSQLVFTFRFVYQWIYCERTKVSELPMGFWILSLCGSLMILIYAVLRLDPVLFVGHILGVLAYIRNIILLRQEVVSVV